MKQSFLLGKKVVIFTTKDESKQNDENTKIVKVIDTITQGASTKFVYMNGKKPVSFEFDLIKELYKATPVTEKVFESMKSRYQKTASSLRNLKNLKFKSKKVNWNFGFRRPGFSTSNA